MTRRTGVFCYFFTSAAGLDKSVMSERRQGRRSGSGASAALSAIAISAAQQTKPICALCRRTRYFDCLYLGIAPYLNGRSRAKRNQKARHAVRERKTSKRVCLIRQACLYIYMIRNFKFLGKGSRENHSLQRGVFP